MATQQNNRPISVKNENSPKYEEHLSINLKFLQALQYPEPIIFFNVSLQEGTPIKAAG